MKKLGIVSWFDPFGGEGEVYCPEDDKTYYVHWSSIVARSLGRCLKEFKNINKHSAVEFSLYTNLYMSQIEVIRSLEFDYTIETEHKINQLLNDLFERGITASAITEELYYNN